MKNDALGFSLLDTALGLAIAGIVAGGLSIGVIKLVIPIRLKSEATRLAALVDSLHILAAQSSANIDLRLNTKGYSAAYASRNETLIEQYRLPKQVEVRLHAPTETIHIYASGASTPVTLTLEAGAHQCKIIFTLRGRSRLFCDGKEAPIS